MYADFLEFVSRIGRSLRLKKISKVLIYSSPLECAPKVKRVNTMARTNYMAPSAARSTY
jgi:hypothetical protein